MTTAQAPLGSWPSSGWLTKTKASRIWAKPSLRSTLSRHARTYDPKALKDLAAQLPKILSSVEGFAELPDLLADVGVRLVYVGSVPVEQDQRVGLPS